MSHQIIFGSSAVSNPIPSVPKPIMTFPGQALTGEDRFDMNEDLFSKHVLLLGGSGCGKTNTFKIALEQLRSIMKEEDVAIIFDTKGEYYHLFHQPQDYVIGNSADFRSVSYTWNIFDEILADGEDEINVNMNAREIAAALFHGRGSSTQPFFCNAARDIFRGLLIHFVRMARKKPVEWRPRLNNRSLVDALTRLTAKDYMKIFSSHHDMKSLLTYFGDGQSNQALGVFGELNSMISEYFVGILAEHNPDRSISMRLAVRQGGRRAIFVEYDLSVGETLAPVYRLLVDQALKEALGRSNKPGQTNRRGRMYLITDEFKLLPKLQHIDDALNFGRGQGVRVMAGIQSIDQLYDIYGKDKGAVIASGFGSMFAFHTNDFASREYIQKRFGTNVMVYDYNDTYRNRTICQERNGNTVEEWDQMELGVGQAIIGMGYFEPFLFQFDEYLRG